MVKNPQQMQSIVGASRICMIRMASFDIDACPVTPANSQVDFSKCLCHKEGTTGKLTSFSIVSWQAFYNAATERNDELYKNFKDTWDNGPLGVYH